MSSDPVIGGMRNELMDEPAGARRHIRRRADRSVPRTARLLHLLLLGSLLPAAWPEAFGAGVPAPFGAPRFVVLALVVFGATTMFPLDASARDSRTLRALRVIIGSLTVVVVAWLLGLIVAERATPFYRAIYLSEAMAVLLIVHACGSLFRSVTPHRPAPLARTWLGDLLVGAATWLVAAFWIIAAVGWRELAGVLLAIGGLTLLACIPVRVAEAWAATKTGTRLRARRGGRPAVAR